MKVTHTLLATEKETPKDAELISHQYMLRAGLIRQVTSGVYTWLPTGVRVLSKIEQIIRQEMKKAGAEEVIMPNILPVEFVYETGRFDKFGADLLTIKDRHKRDFYYGPSHEEPIVDLVRKTLKSYKQLPLNLYQIQTKFRDEIRPRFGVMRAREFIMKDAYSFHNDYASLAHTYQSMYEAYSHILNRIGIAFRAVEADGGAMARPGSKTHEFQILADAGEDIICYSDSSDYAANIEMATYLTPEVFPKKVISQNFTKVATPGIKTIDELCRHLDISADKTIKTLVVKNTAAELFALILRGDHELNEIKLQKLPQFAGVCEFATDEDIQKAFGAEAGSLGPVGVSLPLIIDYSAAACIDFVCGANEDGYHLLKVNWSDEMLNNHMLADIRNVVDGDLSPDGQGRLRQTRGIEVGHIFELGDYYSMAMNAAILDENGKASYPIMGCYGFGVTRIVAAVIEQSHDDKGIIWPKEIAPYDVIILPMNRHKSPEVELFANELYQRLNEAGFDVLFDDRDERAGVMFADADLIGAPHQLIIGAKSLEAGHVEYKCRKTMQKTFVAADCDAVNVFLQQKH
ncbi:MAG: proline--tRNA ligase [Francisellaceae bacterium]